ncbi:peptide deformylase [Desulfurispirillum indicum]|uniref:Peptide deformylase n=1 Tax=Desulfurispirillum indicum (strain ATCC BAA-1389 / DSM 22839 / S5) TaxID=653733 RepID=E6W0N5_DESIS|nr:peptide deformylase [Desulfurispirillum indicum]ADU65287.1 peptide deformylase [Desulfurispirillum indicum S5]UCZ57184.1 peptide deformylase [Desulfurispirillum indicum]
MIHPILTYPDPLLKKISQPVTQFDSALQQLVSDMFDTMYNANGVGLAAPQIGILRRICVLDPASGKEEEAQPLVLINPQILSGEGLTTFEEGCLSVPGYYGEIKRYERIQVQFNDLQGQEQTAILDGFTAIIAQHEMDHLNGKLFIEHLGSSERDLIRRKIRKAMKEGSYQ